MKWTAIYKLEFVRVKMKKLTGTLRQRIDEVIRLAHSVVDDEQCTCFCKFYAEAGEELLPAAISFY